MQINTTYTTTTLLYSKNLHLDGEYLVTTKKPTVIGQLSRDNVKFRPEGQEEWFAIDSIDADFAHHQQVQCARLGVSIYAIEFVRNLYRTRKQSKYSVERSPAGSDFLVKDGIFMGEIGAQYKAFRPYGQPTWYDVDGKNYESVKHIGLLILAFLLEKRAPFDSDPF